MQGKNNNWNWNGFLLLLFCLCKVRGLIRLYTYGAAKKVFVPSPISDGRKQVVVNIHTIVKIKKLKNAMKFNLFVRSFVYLLCACACVNAANLCMSAHCTYSCWPDTPHQPLNKKKMGSHIVYMLSNVCQKSNVMQTLFCRWCIYKIKQFVEKKTR